MKKLLLAGVAGVALAVGAPANAADLGTRPTYKAPPAIAPVPIFTWSGCYIGGHVGGGWGQKEFADATGEPNGRFFVGSTKPESIRANTSGFLGGGQVGCDYQFAPNWLIGVQGSGSAANIKGDVLDTFWEAADPGLGKTFHARTDWLADVTGRVGVVWDRFMIYGKGGVAWAGDKYNVTEGLGCACTIFPPPETRTGFVAGVGLEWAFWTNLSAFVEWDFYGFGTRTVAFNQICQSTGCIPFNFGLTDVKQDINVVKAGLNWRFNWGKAPIGKGPVVAKY
jgi:outer membrane immunogenic protein